jgi:hypothetical protein
MNCAARLAPPLRLSCRNLAPLIQRGNTSSAHILVRTLFALSARRLVCRQRFGFLVGDAVGCLLWQRFSGLPSRTYTQITRGRRSAGNRSRHGPNAGGTWRNKKAHALRFAVHGPCSAARDRRLCRGCQLRRAIRLCSLRLAARLSQS